MLVSLRNRPSRDREDLAAPLPDGGDQIELVLRVEAIEHLVERVPPESKVVHDGMFEIASSLVQ
jgi:hypothetical protein